jgi:solute carrier family 25 carnitine/acylcarnitine transporter 20/29
VRDWCCGTVTGIIGRTIEFPADTVKVRLQAAGSPYAGTWDCVSRTWRQHGVAGFYNGASVAYATASFTMALSFATFGAVSKQYRAHVMPPLPQASSLHGREDTRPLPISGLALSGGIAGGITSLAHAPIEFTKVRMQAQPRCPLTQRGLLYDGVADCWRKCIAAHGWFVPFASYRAAMTTAVPGVAAWYTMHGVVVRRFGDDPAARPWYASLAGGGAAGVGYWSAIFPLDTVKTRMQSDATFGRRGIRAAIVTIVREGGVRALYKGYCVTAARALPSSAVTFGVMDWLRRTWDKVEANMNNRVMV